MVSKKKLKKINKKLVKSNNRLDEELALVTSNFHDLLNFRGEKKELHFPQPVPNNEDLGSERPVYLFAVQSGAENSGARSEGNKCIQSKPTQYPDLTMVNHYYEKAFDDLINTFRNVKSLRALVTLTKSFLEHECNSIALRREFIKHLVPEELTNEKHEELFDKFLNLLVTNRNNYRQHISVLNDSVGSILGSTSPLSVKAIKELFSKTLKGETTLINTAVNLDLVLAEVGFNKAEGKRVSEALMNALRYFHTPSLTEEGTEKNIATKSEVPKSTDDLLKTALKGGRKNNLTVTTLNEKLEENTNGTITIDATAPHSKGDAIRATRFLQQMMKSEQGGQWLDPKGESARLFKEKFLMADVSHLHDEILIKLPDGERDSAVKFISSLTDQSNNENNLTENEKVQPTFEQTTVDDNIQFILSQDNADFTPMVLDYFKSSPKTNINNVQSLQTFAKKMVEAVKKADKSNDTKDVENNNESTLEPETDKEFFVAVNETGAFFKITKVRTK